MTLIFFLPVATLAVGSVAGLGAIVDSSAWWMDLVVGASVALAFVGLFYAYQRENHLIVLARET